MAIKWWHKLENPDDPAEFGAIPKKYGSPIRTAGRFGYGTGLRYEGDGVNITIPGFHKKATVSLWDYSPSGYDWAGASFYLRHDYYNGVRLQGYFRDSIFRCYLVHGKGSDWIEPGTQFLSYYFDGNGVSVFDRWVHWTIIFDNDATDKLRLFIDGVERQLIQKIIDTGYSQPFNLNVGPRSNYINPGIPGVAADNWVVYDEVIPAEQISWLAQNENPFEGPYRPPVDMDILIHHTLDGATNSIIGQNPAWTGTHSFPTGKFGNALNCSGINNGSNSVSFGSIPAGAKTLSFFIKPNNQYLGRTQTIISSQYQGQGMEIGFEPSGKMYGFINKTSGGTMGIYNIGCGNLSDGAWHHVCFMFMEDDCRVYVDGVRKHGTPYGMTGTPAGVVLSLGGWTGGNPGDTRYDGLLDNLIVFGRSLSPKEVLWAKDAELLRAPLFWHKYDYPVQKPEIGTQGTHEFYGAPTFDSGKWGGAARIDAREKYGKASLPNQALRGGRRFSVVWHQKTGWKMDGTNVDPPSPWYGYYGMLHITNGNFDALERISVGSFYNWSHVVGIEYFNVGGGSSGSVLRQTYYTEPNKWYQWAIIVDEYAQQKVKLFIDGDLVASSTNIWSQFSGNNINFFFGKRYYNNSDHQALVGLMDNVMIFDYPITETELDWLRNDEHWLMTMAQTTTPAVEQFRRPIMIL